MFIASPEKDENYQFTSPETIVEGEEIKKTNLFWKIILPSQCHDLQHPLQ